MVFWNKNKIKELNMIDIFFSYFSKVGKTDIKIKIDDKDLNRKIISNVNKEDLSKLQLCNIPVFKIQSLYDENLTSKHIVEFENNFVNMEDVLLDQDAYSLYKIGLEIIYELNNSKYLEVDKFKIEIEEGAFTCDYCNSGFRSIYYVYYDKKLLFKTKHNNLPEENNCPFLFNLEDSIEENLVVNKNIIIQLLFEALKIKYKNKINFYISEDNEIIEVYKCDPILKTKKFKEIKNVK